jgi:ABC-2 type transport system permease protein
MKPLVRQLIAKELHLNRAFLAGVTAAGLLSLVVAAGGELGFQVGFLMWLTAIIALGVMLALFGVANERKERALQFVLSLPLAPTDYVLAKLLGLLLCFLLPWGVLSLGALALVALMPGMADGLLPYGVLLCAYLLANYALVLCATLHVRSEAGMAGVIVLTNMSVSLFMMGIPRIPEIGSHMAAAAPVWNGAFWQVLAAELAVTLLALTLPLFTAARRRDFL